jgi:hypothetical protein
MGEGDGFGFRYQRRNHFAAVTKHRLHLNSAPIDFDYAESIAILDEDQLTPIETITPTKLDLVRAWSSLEVEHTEAYDALRDLRLVLQRLTEADHGYRGLNHAAIMAALPAPPSDLTLIEQAIAALGVEIETLLTPPDGADTQALTRAIAALDGKIQRLEAKLAAADDFDRGNLEFEIEALKKERWALGQERDSLKSFNRFAKQQATRNFIDDLKDAPTQALDKLLRVWAGLDSGALRISPFGQLQISLYQPSQNHVLNKFCTVVHLDATGDRNILAMRRQIAPESILVIDAEPDRRLDNLQVIQVTGLGLLGKDRSTEADRRIKALLNAIKPDVTFDWLKKKADSGAVGHWFSDHTRGTNHYAGAATIVAIGLPTVNYGAVEDEFQTLRGGDYGVSLPDAYKHRIDAEITQAIGRNRSIRTPDQGFKFYLLGDSDNSKNLNYQIPARFNAEIVEAQSITPDAGSRWEIFVAKVQAAIEAIKTEGGEITKSALARGCGVSRAYIQKVWERVQPVLLGSLYREGCTPPAELKAEVEQATGEVLEGKIHPLSWLSKLFKLSKTEFPVLASPDPWDDQSISDLTATLSALVGQVPFEVLLNSIDAPAEIIQYALQQARADWAAAESF